MNWPAALSVGLQDRNHLLAGHRNPSNRIVHGMFGVNGRALELAKAYVTLTPAPNHANQTCIYAGLTPGFCGRGAVHFSVTGFSEARRLTAAA